MEKSLSFIVLPKEESGLSEAQAAMLLGGDICKNFTTCIELHGSYCFDRTNEECSANKTGCGEIMHCTGHGEVQKCDRLFEGCIVKL